MVKNAEQRHRHVLALVERGGGQHVVGVAVGLVHVEVERHEQVELAQRPLERVAVGHRQHRVAGGHEQRADLALARRLDLQREQRGRQVADHVGEAAEARAHLAVGGQADLLAELVERDRRVPEHRAARAVEVAGDRVERVEQEGDQRAEAAQAGAGAAVGGGAVGARRSRAPARARAPAGMPVARLGGLGRVTARAALAARRRPRRALARKARSARPSSKIAWQHREQQPGVRVGADRQVLELARRLACGADHDTPATRARCSSSCSRTRGALQHRPVRDERVGAHHEQEVGALEVGDRHQQRRAVQQRARGEAVVHVLRAGRVVVRRADARRGSP